jgi:hypothetical protein
MSRIVLLISHNKHLHQLFSPQTLMYTLYTATRRREDCSRPSNEAAYALLQLQASLSDKCTMLNQSMQKSSLVSFERDALLVLFSGPLLAS